jgi:hypothetical protein
MATKSILNDISGDCRKPQQLTGASVGLDDGTGQFVAAVRGHEGNFAPDGLTYYGTNVGGGYIYPIDITTPSAPKMLTQFFTPIIQLTHGLSFSEDGTLACGCSNGTPSGYAGAQVSAPTMEQWPQAQSTDWGGQQPSGTQWRNTRSRRRSAASVHDRRRRGRSRRQQLRLDGRVAGLAPWNRPASSTSATKCIPSSSSNLQLR